jgi:hypothetical protein
MGIRSMDFTEWIQVSHSLSSRFSSLFILLSKIDNRYARYHAIRTHRTSTGGTDTVRTMPANEEFGVPGGGVAGNISCHITPSPFN